MDAERDNLSIFLGLIGLISLGYAIKLTLNEVSGRLFYIFLAVQLIILTYLLYAVGGRLKEAWTVYRWSPDRLR